MPTKKEPIWIARELSKCSGCRKCEIVCSLSHENRIWPEASRIRVFMLVPGTEFPHFCAQCEDYPCVKACPVNALSISKRTGSSDKNQSLYCLRKMHRRLPRQNSTYASSGKPHYNLRLMQRQSTMRESLSRRQMECTNNSFKKRPGLQTLCTHARGNNTGFGY